MVKISQMIKDDVYETYVVVKVCLTSFWFWLPVLFGGYMVLQIWLLVAVHPLTIVILPGIIAAYLIVTREKRMKTQYGINDGNSKGALHPYSLTTTEKPSFSWDVEKALEEYEKMAKDKEENEGEDRTA